MTFRALRDENMNPENIYQYNIVAIIQCDSCDSID